MTETSLSLPVATPLRPPLKWAGGKRWLVPHLLPLWKPHSVRRLVEPFCGALAATLAMVPDKALLNDRNPHVMNFYSWVKRGLQITLWMENDEELYYAHRKRFNELLQDGGGENSRNGIRALGSSPSPPSEERAGERRPVLCNHPSVPGQSAEAASLFYYLNRTGFNGLCRFNSLGEFNVPFGRYKTINYCRDFSAYEPAFAKWEFVSADFESVPLQPDDFVYADPPFDVEFTQYSKEAFTWEDQIRAAEWLARHKGPVILSNQATDRIVALYEKLGFKLQFLDAPRRISCTGDRTPAREVLAVRNVRTR